MVGNITINLDRVKLNLGPDYSVDITGIPLPQVNMLFDALECSEVRVDNMLYDSLEFLEIASDLGEI